MFKRKKLTTISVTALTAISLALPGPVLAKNKAVEFLKYFNPIPEDSYKNESQDRVIKKKKFSFVEVPGASPVVNPETGFFAIVPLEMQQDREAILSLLERENINGISVLLPWQHLEPTEFNYDWSKLDKILEIAAEKKKKVIVRVSTCGLDNKLKSDTPEWVFKAGAKSIEFYGTDGEKHLMPIFWDSTYLAKWSNFVNAMGDKYDKNKNIHSVGITGGGILGSTKVIPNFVTINKVKDSDKNEDEGKKDEKGVSEETIDSSTLVALEDGSGAAQETPSSDADDKPEPTTDTATPESVETKDTEEKENSQAAAETEENTEENTEKIETVEADKPAAEKNSGEEKPVSKEKNIEPSSSKDKTSEIEVDDDEDTAENVEIESEPSKANYRNLYKQLKKDYQMSERQLVEHWKYVADIFPNAFKETRLNFDVNPPIKGGKGQSGLDEISDYLIYRYGQRVYLTRQNVANAKHGFNEFRVLLKFHYDTLTGFQLSPDFEKKDMEKLSKIALVDGISYVELPINLIKSEDQAVKDSLAKIHSHIGYQLVSREVSLPSDAKVGDPLKTSFTFVNLGAATALNPKRELDKDQATSYKVQLEFRNSKGKPIMRSLHTPDIPTNEWIAGKPITWEEELKMPELKPGKYEVFMSIIDTDTKHKLRFLKEVKEGELLAGTDAPVGSLELVQ
ncbi:DUF4832 domain-containing protein [bacterium]|nr:DUF4832 domain-containing protein [bacterium]